MNEEQAVFEQLNLSDFKKWNSSALGALTFMTSTKNDHPYPIHLQKWTIDLLFKSRKSHFEHFQGKIAYFLPVVSFLP